MINSDIPKTVPGKLKELQFRILAGTQAYTPEQLLNIFKDDERINWKKLCEVFAKQYESSHDKKFVDSLVEAALGMTVKEFLDICTYGDN